MKYKLLGFLFQGCPMASPITQMFKKPRITFFLIITLLNTVATSKQKCPNFKSIISFGDSITDTGNLLHLSADTTNLPQAAFPPYGETFFHSPTGRFSDGRLIIDFISEYLGLPYVSPYFGSQNVSFEKGVNFAVAGATALEQPFLESLGIHYAHTNISLKVQLNIFKESLPHLCNSQADCREKIGDALIIVGEIGGNDYNFGFLVGKTVKEIKELIPRVIKTISSVITELISLGGKTIFVPSDFPLGCWTVYLSEYQTSNEEEYDPVTGCLKWLNDFIELHNKKLQTELNRLQKLYPYVTILYADYYNALFHIFQEPAKFGFMDRPLSACCGSGGQYNYNNVSQCGTKGVDCCIDPSKYVHWDGFHLTEAAYRWIAMGILKGPYTIPAFDWSCSGLENRSSSGEDYAFSSM